MGAGKKRSPDAIRGLAGSSAPGLHPGYTAALSLPFMGEGRGEGGRP